MSKVKLKKLINELEFALRNYIEKHGKDPVIWNLEISCGDFEELELTHNVKKKNGFTTAVNGTETYSLRDLN